MSIFICWLVLHITFVYVHTTLNILHSDSWIHRQQYIPMVCHTYVSVWAGLADLLQSCMQVACYTYDLTNMQIRLHVRSYGWLLWQPDSWHLGKQAQKEKTHTHTLPTCTPVLPVVCLVLLSALPPNQLSLPSYFHCPAPILSIARSFSHPIYIYNPDEQIYSVTGQRTYVTHVSLHICLTAY